MITCGVSDHGLRERMLREPGINLKKAVELGQAAEETKLHAKQLAEDMSRSVHKIKKHKHGIPKDKEEKHSKSHAKTAVKMINNCKFCAGSHPRGKCPAYGQKCNSCHKKNHFARCCNRKVHQVSNQGQESNTSSDSDTDFVIDSIVIADKDPNLTNDFDLSIKIDAIKDDTSTSHWSVRLETNNESIKYKIDTGVHVNVLPRHLFKKLSPPPKLKSTPIKLSAYNGSNIPVHGKCILPVNHRSKKFHVLFIVVDSNNTVPIIGLKTSERLNLVRRVFKVNTSELEDDAEFIVDYILDDYLDCFGDLGALNRTYHIELKDNVQPTVVPPRKVLFALRDKLKKELDRMEKMDVIEKVEKSTDWVSAAVVVEWPNGKLHVCLDPRPLS